MRLIMTQFVSQHLAGGITRYRGDDGDVPRLFKARHLVLQILPQFGFVDVGTRTGDDEGSEPLAEGLIRNTDHRVVGQVGMFAKDVLNRARVDVPETIMSSSRPTMNSRPASSK